MVSTSTYQASGWARLLSETGDGEGWVSLNGAGYGVSIDPSSGEFSGWAWDSDTAGRISFNCDGDSGCDSVTEDYFVYTSATSSFFQSPSVPVVTGPDPDTGFVGTNNVFEFTSKDVVDLDTTGLVAGFDMNEGSGSTLTDSSSYNNDGTLNGSVTWTPSGKFSSALVFDGSSSGYVRVSDDPSLDLTQAVSIEGWVYYDNTSSSDYSTIVGRNHDNNGGYALGAYHNGPSSNDLIFAVTNSSGADLVAWPSSSNLPSEEWMHVVGTYDNTSGQGEVALYINGEQVDYGTFPSFGDIQSLSKDLTIGGDPDNTSGAPLEFQGIIDEVQVYDRALSESEVADRYVEYEEIRYGIDWDATDADNSVDEWIPASGYVLSNEVAPTTHMWNAAGLQTLQVLVEDKDGRRSGWISDSISIFDRSPYTMARDIQTESQPNPLSVTASSPDLSALYASSTQFAALGSSWDYYREVYVRNDTSKELMDYQVEVIVDTDTLTSQGKLKSQCEDLRFVDPYEDEVVPLYVNADNCGNSNTSVWVKVPILRANATTTLVMFYGNEGASTASNGDDVFIFFDDFEDGDFSEWDTSTGWTIDSTYANNGINGARSGTNWSELLSINLSDPLTSGILEAHVRFSSVGISHFFPFNPKLVGGPDPKAYWAVAVTSSEVMHWVGSGNGGFSSYPIPVNYTDDTWYSFKVKFDFSAGSDGKHWVFIDDTNYAGSSGVDIVGYDGQDGHEALTGWNLRVSDPDNGEYYWVDDVRIRAFGSHDSEPTTTVSDTENQSGYISASNATAYQLQVIAYGGDWTNPLWDTGKSTTTLPVGNRENIAYGESSLNTDGQKYFQRWRFWNSVDEVTLWSDGEDEWTMLNDPPPSVPIFISAPASGSVDEDLTFEFEAHDRLATSSDGLLVGFEMEEGSGTALDDDSTENNDGQIQPAVVWTGDGYESASALDFDASASSYVFVEDSLSLAETTKAATYEAWVKLDNTSIAGTTTIISRQDTIAEQATSTVGGFALGASFSGPSSNNISFSVVNEAGDSLIAEPSSDNLNADTWYHVVGVFDNTSDQAQTKLYIDGVEVVNQTNAGWGNAGFISKDLTIGGDPLDDSLAPREFSGIIDNVKVYNRALTAQEIQDHYDVYDQIRYGIDWNNDSTVDEWVPTNVPSAQYVTSGTIGATTTSWSTAGDYTFQVLAEDDRGGRSTLFDWASHTVTITDNSLLPSVSLSPLSARILYDSSTSINWSVTDADLGCVATDDTADGINWENLVPNTPDDSGLQETGNLTSTTTFSMSCENSYGTYATSTVVGVIEPECSDGVDNDDDSLIDEDDPACHYPIENIGDEPRYHATGTNESNNPECSDNKDNDLDGRIDSNDGGCYDNYDPSSGNYVPQWDKEQTCEEITSAAFPVCDPDETFGTCPVDCRFKLKLFEF